MIRWIRLFVIFLIIAAFSLNIFSAIPVIDTAAIDQLIDQMVEMFGKYDERDSIVTELLEEEIEFFESLRDVIYKSESLFNAVTFYPKDLPGLYEFGAYFLDRKKKEIWHDLFAFLDSLFNKYGYLKDISFIKENNLAKISPAWRQWCDFFITLDEEDNRELENTLHLLADMRGLQIERKEVLNRYLPLITKAWGKTSADSHQNVDVTKLYYAAVCAEIEGIKQLQQTEIMLRAFLELHLKDCVNSTRFKKKYADLNKHNSIVWDLKKTLVGEK